MKLLLLLPFFLLTTCATYNQSVASRSVGLTGYSKDSGAVGGQVGYTVNYR